MTNKEEQITDLDKKGLSGENINNGKAMEDLSLKDQHCFQVMLYVNHFKSTEINVGVDGGVVIVNGHHEARTDAHGFIRRKFSRKYNLPDDVKPENLIAVFSENGILTIRASDEKGHKEYDDENSNQLENLYATFKPVQFKDGVPKEDPTADSGDISTETADSDVSTETADSGDVSTEDPTACSGVSTEGAKVKQTSAASQAEVMTPAVVPKSDAKSPKSATRSEEAKSPKSATRSEEAESDAKPPRATTKSEAAKPEEVKSDPKSSKSETRSEEAKPDPKPPRSTSKSEAAKSPKSETRSEEAKSSKSATRSEEAKSDPKSSKSATRSEEAKPDPKPPRSTTKSEAPKSATRSEEAKSDAKPKSATRSEGRGKS